MDSRKRFSDRVDSYVKYRPDYPCGAIDIIMSQFGLNGESVVADIGSGTGKFTRHFNNRVKIIYGVEPNDEMREASESLLAGQKNYRAVKGDAENTTLETSSVDAVVCAQAFHWFDIKKANTEFGRILRGNRNVALIWNRRRTDTPFLSGYEKLLREYANDYNEVTHHNLDENGFRMFYRSYGRQIIPNHQAFDFESLRGRLYSSSYCPLPGEPAHDILFRKLKALFTKFQANGKVFFEYDTEIFYGSI